MLSLLQRVLQRVLLIVSVLCAAVLWGQQPDLDADGCKDSRVLPRMQGCVIRSCSLKRDDFVEMQVGRQSGDSEQRSLRGDILMLNYSCSKQLAPQKIVRSSETLLRAAGFQVVYNGLDDSSNPIVTAHSRYQWVEVAASQQGEASNYKLTVAQGIEDGGAGDKAAAAVAMVAAQPEVCRDSQVLPKVSGCAILDCASREGDSVEMLVAREGDEPRETTLEGKVLTIHYGCPKSLPPLWILNDTGGTLRKSGFEIIFLTDDTDNPMMTARSGDQWVEIVAGQLDEGTTYSFTAAKVHARQPEVSKE